MYLEERLEKFLIQYHDKLVEMSTEDFEAKKDGLVIKLLERSKNLTEENSKFWSHIRSGYQDFLQSEWTMFVLYLFTLTQSIETQARQMPKVWRPYNLQMS